jgi:hypothetical protein
MNYARLVGQWAPAYNNQRGAVEFRKVIPWLSVEKVCSKYPRGKALIDK